MSLLPLPKTGLRQAWAAWLLQQAARQCKALLWFDAAVLCWRNFSSRGTRSPSWLGPCGRAGETDRDGLGIIAGRSQAERSHQEANRRRTYGVRI